MARTSRRRGRSAIARLLLVGGFAAPALVGASASAECSSTTAADSYADARRAFEEKRYDDSVSLLRRAYACDSNPVYLANIARAYEEANRPKDALAAWQAYLAAATDERERRLTEGRISALTKVVEDLDRLEREKKAAEEAKRQAEERAQERRAAPLDQASPAPRPPVPAAAWIVLGAGGVGIAAGGVLGELAVLKHSSARQQPSVDDAVSMQNTAVGLARAANWAFAAGGVLAAAGLAWIAIDRLRAPRAAGAHMGLAVSGNGLEVVGVFR